MNRDLEKILWDYGAYIDHSGLWKLFADRNQGSIYDNIEIVLSGKLFD